MQISFDELHLNIDEMHINVGEMYFLFFLFTLYIKEKML